MVFLLFQSYLFRLDSSLFKEREEDRLTELDNVNSLATSVQSEHHLIGTVEFLDRPRQIGGGDPVIVEEPRDLGRIEGI